MTATARLLVLAALVCAMGLSAALACDEPVPWIELLRYAPYPVWLVPAAVALVASLPLGWGWRLAGMATLLLVLTRVMGLSLGLERATQAALPELRRVRVMTYNIKSYEAQWRGFGPIAAEIRRHAPDILLLQDADEPDGIDGVLQQALAGYTVHRYQQYLVASRLPLRQCEDRQEAVLHERRLSYVRCSVLVDRMPLTVLTTHFLTPRQGLNAARSERLAGLDDWHRNVAVRMAQARRLADVLATLPRPLVVAGDLNAAESSPVVQTLLDIGGLQDAYGSAGRGWGYTLGHALRPHISFLRIDHVLASREVSVADAFAGGKDGSEHRPVIADLLVPH